jgi:hypothetical protein
MYRRYRDAVVTRVPTAREIEELESLAPGTDIQIEVRKDDRLSEMPYQDSYSYEVAVIFTGGPSHDALLSRYRRLTDSLPLRFDESVHDDGSKSAGERVRT